MKRFFITTLLAPLLALICGTASAFETKEIFGSQWDVSLIKIGANEIAQTGILRHLATDYIEDRKLDYSISWLQGKNSELIKSLQNNKIDMALMCSDIDLATGKKFVKVEIFFNNYVLIGPKNNLAKINREEDIIAMFKKISDYGQSNSQKIFIGHADDSDAFYNEHKIWQQAGIAPNKALWYEKSAADEKNLLQQADENFLYAFVELSTILDNKKLLKNSFIYSARDNSVKNSCNLFYKKKPNMRINAFVLYMKSKAAQDIIANFGKENYKMAIYNLNQ